MWALKDSESGNLDRIQNISERDGGWVDVTWKVPVRGGKLLAIPPGPLWVQISQ